MQVEIVPVPNRKRGLGMVVLFLTEMWERYSFYGMKALLAPFLVAAFGYSMPEAKEALGTYVLLVYLSPLFAGILADRFLNLRSSIYVGAIVMAFGEFALSYKPLTFVGLALIIAGNGFFKPCAANMVGALYPKEDPKRTGAYMLFYFGINVGAFISPFICGWLRKDYGFGYGFAAAGVGMLIGLLTFALYEHMLGQAGLKQNQGSSHDTRIDSNEWKKVMMYSIVTIAGVGLLTFGRGMLNVLWTPKWLLGETASPTTLFLVRMALIGVALWIYTKIVPKAAEARPLTKDEKDRIWIVVAMSAAMFLLVIALEQSGGTLNFFAKDKTDPTFLGIAIPYEFYQSVNPLFVMGFALITRSLWPKLEKRGLNDLRRLGPGLLLVAASFFLLKGAEGASAHGEKASPGWLFAIYFFIAAGEVCISVTGLSAVQKVSPPHLQAFFNALFSLSVAVGGYLAGTVDSILKELKLDPWTTLGTACIVSAIVFMLSANKLMRLSHGVFKTADELSSS